MSRRGFTLIEVLIAIGLLLLLAGLMANFGITLADRKDRIERVGSDVATISAVFSQLDTALTAADANNAGVRVSETSLTIASRRTSTSMSVTEFDELNLTFDQAESTLTVSRSVTDFSLKIADVERVRFLAYDGNTWDEFSDGSLPQALEVSVWFAAANDSTDPRVVAAESGPAFANSSLFLENEADDSPPDRWRVFSLVDTLREVGP